MSCVEHESYGAFARAIHARAERTRTPIYATLELTRRCNLRCAHCYNNLPADHSSRHNELSTDEVRRLIDEMCEMGSLWLLITGGEPLLRPDFLEIYSHARRSGLVVTVFTNASLISEPLADALAELPPFRVEVSIYGTCAATHEVVTCVDGSYERTLRGVDRLRTRGLAVTLKTMALNVNRHEIWPLRARVQNELAEEFRFDGFVNGRLDGATTRPLTLRLPPEGVVALDLLDPRRTRDWTRLFDRYLGASTPAGGGKLYECAAGLTSLSIDPYGGLRPCALSNGPAYDLRHGRLHEGWFGFLADLRSTTLRRATKCVSCALRPLCGMCPAHAELEHGDPEEPVEHLCETAHIRAVVLGYQVPNHGDCAYCPGGALHSRTKDKARALLRRDSLGHNEEPPQHDVGSTAGRGEETPSETDEEWA